MRFQLPSTFERSTLRFALRGLIGGPLLIALVLTARVSVAEAQETTPQRLAVQVDPAVVDAQALARELERDLGIAIQLSVAGDADAVLRVRVTETGAVRLELTREGRGGVAREVEPPSDAGERVVALALIAANLVRDQSAEILAFLRIERVGPAPAPEPPVVIVGPAPVEAPVPEVDEEPAPEPAESPVAEPPAQDPPALDDVPVAIDFAPFVGFSSGFLGRDRRGVSIGVLGSLMGELTGVSIAGVVDLVLGDASGVQIAGVLALADRLRGVQLSGGLTLALGDADGLQIAPVAVASGSVYGSQIGAVAVAGGSLAGVQLGVVDVAGDSTTGLQIGALALTGGELAGGQLGVVNVAGAGVAGLQIGAVNVAGVSVSGLQLGAVNVSGASLMGVQIGAVNTSGQGASGLQLAAVNVAGGDVAGVQVGAVNVSAGRVRGLQVGVVNIAEDADASIGLVSVYPRGRTQLRVGADSGGLLSANLVHGARITHSILSVATQPFQERPAALLGLGLGVRATIEDAMHLDVDALAHVVLDERVSNVGPSAMFELRAVFGARVFDVLGLYAGLGYQVLLESEPEAGGLGGPFGVSELSSNLRGWPVLLGGIELF